MQVTADKITVDEALPARSRTFSPEVVAQVHTLLTERGVANVGIGTFEEEGTARSSLTTLNRLLVTAHGVGPFAATVRKTDAGYKAILLNRPARKVTRKPKASKAPAKASA